MLLGMSSYLGLIHTVSWIILSCLMHRSHVRKLHVGENAMPNRASLVLKKMLTQALVGASHGGLNSQPGIVGSRSHDCG